MAPSTRPPRPTARSTRFSDGTPKPRQERRQATSQGGTSGEGSEIKAELDPGYVSSVFYDPKTKYIWALALDREGRLYVATGDKGEVYRVDPRGCGALFFRSDETHIRSLAFDAAGNLIAGSDGSGLIYRISPQGEGFVLYSAPKKEITALAVDAQGAIYAAGAGDKKVGNAQMMSSDADRAAAAAGATGPAIINQNARSRISRFRDRAPTAPRSIASTPMALPTVSGPRATTWSTR
jgi:hypothetical protein